MDDCYRKCLQKPGDVDCSKKCDPQQGHKKATPKPTQDKYTTQMEYIHTNYPRLRGVHYRY